METYYLDLFRLANGVLTLGFMPYLYGVYKKTQRRFYLLWGIGFALYGISIIVRSIIPNYSPDGNYLLVLINFFVFQITGFILIITGVGDLIGKPKLVLISAILIPLSTVMVYFTSGPESLGWAFSLSPYFFLAFGLLTIRIKFQASLDLLVIGWFSLLLTNIAIPLELMTPVYIEVYAIFSKIIIFLGMTSPRFSFMYDELASYLIGGIPETYIEETFQTFMLINSQSSNKEREIQWIKDRIKNNVEAGVRNILVTTYDVISPQEVKAMGIEEEEVYIVRMIPGRRGSNVIFDQPILTINDNMNELDVLLSDIIAFSNDRRIRCEIILHTFSSLLNTHEWKRVYSFMISKLPQLKSSMVQFSGIYYPDAHSVEDIIKFEKMADQIIYLPSR